ncbi:hypothetical protein MMC11_005962 [Xylographa trunciseda]|nr:hypothetical protein [Xylographa trunciseda]
MSSCIRQRKRLTSRANPGIVTQERKLTSDQLLNLVARVLNGNIPCQILRIRTSQTLLTYVYEILLASPLVNRLSHTSLSQYVSTVKAHEYVTPYHQRTHLDDHEYFGITSRTASDASIKLASGPKIQFIWNTNNTDSPARDCSTDVSGSGSRPGQQDTALGTRKASYSPSASPKYIVLAHRSWPEKRWTLLQVDCTEIRSDHDLFKELQQVEKRRHLTKASYITSLVPWFLLSVDQITYVKFATLDTGFGIGESLEILESPSVPPEAQRSYYCPCGRDFEIWPPISPALLAHYYNHPDLANSGAYLLDRIPKRLNSPIVHKHQYWQGKRATGWGLELEYKLQPKVVLIAGLSAWAGTSFLVEQILFRKHSFTTYNASLAVTPVFALTVMFLYQRSRLLRQKIPRWRMRLALLLANSILHCYTSASLNDTWSCEACSETVHGPTRNVTDPASVSQPIEFHPAPHPLNDPAENPLSSYTASSASSSSSILPPPATYSPGHGNVYRGIYDEEKGRGSSKTRIEDIAWHEKIETGKAISRFFICATTGPDHLLRLHEKVITDTLNDQQFFQYLTTLPRTSIYKPWAWLTGVVAINYITFERLDSGHVSLLRRPGYAPPSRKYQYFRCKEQADLNGFTTSNGCFHPFPSEVLLQKYRNPTAADTGTYYIDRLTRKLDGPLTWDEQDRTAYGIELEPGITKGRVIGFGGVGFVFCVMFGVIWSKIFHDVSAGFTIASCMLVAVVFVLSTAVQSFERLRPVYDLRAG